jgi:sulfate adenylyltransferase
MVKIRVNDDIIQDVNNLVDGVYSPLTGFLRQKDYQSVLGSMRLANGEVWGMPIMLDVDEHEVQLLKNNDEVILMDTRGREIAGMKNVEVFKYDKDEYAQKIYGTKNIKHPGVHSVINKKDYFLGGDIFLISQPKKIFEEFNLTPAQTIALFKNRGWKTVAAFQTRNIPHRGHEFLQKHAMQQVDGLLIQPVVGWKKSGDFKDKHILSAYEILIDRYFGENEVLLGALPLRMNYAGPREALMHALIRRNYGCTHFIVGRDHAGVGDFYHPLAAQKIFDNFKNSEIGIEILKYGEVVYNKMGGEYCFAEECGMDNRESFSGTVLRNSIVNKEELPAHLIRPEIYDFLTKSNNLLV